MIEVVRTTRTEQETVTTVYHYSTWDECFEVLETHFGPIPPELRRTYEADGHFDALRNISPTMNVGYRIRQIA